ncbi:hypothetical protein Q1695_001366 [Nippostrongylus brasiliensis]|nr:hypothetical protein Q1695_001366 [Nippostrongylus brasiliensis]
MSNGFVDPERNMSSSGEKCYDEIFYKNHTLEKLIQDLTYQTEEIMDMAHLSEKDDEVRAVRSQRQVISRKTSLEKW